MNILIKILTSILTVLVLIPTVGINFNTHICGQTKEVSKSLIIPGILSPEECDKCHQVVVAKSCCSIENEIVNEELEDQKNDEGCCEDILEYSSFDYLTIPPFVQNLVDTSTFTLEQSQAFIIRTNTFHDKINIRTRLRPFVANIISLKCSYLI